MTKQGKKFQTASVAVGESARSPQSAVSLAKKSAFAKFDETVELHIHTSADVRHAEQQIREVVTLPNGTGKQVRVLVFAEGSVAEAAREAGADYVSDDAIIKQIEGGWTDFEVALATPDQMGKIGRLGRYLGRKGLMPNPRTGTVVQPDAIAGAIDEARKGRVEIRMDKTGVVHTSIGKVSFEEEALVENLKAIVSTLIKAKPDEIKGQLMKKATLVTTMGPAINIDLPALEALAV
ncbi:MAG: 50S ribosomal protein L1 [Chloroflexi bacterium]|nr:50S ribosomal protein L1 [Chloroflexota bacterium]